MGTKRYFREFGLALLAYIASQWLLSSTPVSYTHLTLPTKA